MSHYSVERLINLIINDVNKTSSCVLDLCNKTDHRAILCDCCECWIHIGCNDIFLSVYENLKSKSDLWHCLVCIIRNNLESIPFTSCDDTELININSTNSMRFL